MTIYDETWAGNAHGTNPPAGWTSQWYTSQRGWTVAHIGGSPAPTPPAGWPADNVAMRHGVSGGGGGKQHNALYWTAPGSAVGDGEMLARIWIEAAQVAETGGGKGVLGMRLSGGAHSGNGFLCVFENGYFLIAKIISGAWTVLAQTAFTLVGDTSYGVAMRVDGSQIRASAWLANTTRPSTWMLDVTNTGSTPGATGSVGLYPGYTQIGGVWYDRVMLGTGADVPDFPFPETPGPRGVTLAQRAVIAANQVIHHLYVESQDADGTWQDITNLAGKDYLIGATWGEDVGSPVSGAAVTIRRIGGTNESLVPLMTGSTLNRDAADAYAPFLDIGRLIRWFTATLPPGVAVTGSDWEEAFTGRIDAVQWESEPIVATCSDLGAWLMDTQIEAEVDYGTGGVAVETVMQSIINLWPSGKGTPTLYTPTTPGWIITPYRQPRVKVLPALVELAEQIGWDIRFRYDSTGVSRLTFMDPDRGNTVVDATFDGYEYDTISRLSVSLTDIKNVGTAAYIDATGAEGTVTAQDNTSIARVGRRYFQLGNNKNIRTSTDAQRLIDAAVSDMAQPDFEHEVTLRYVWFIQLFHRYTFLANGILYDEDQTLAVTGFTHRLEGGEGWTTIRCAGKITGGYARWQRRATQALPVAPAIYSLALSVTSSGAPQLLGHGNETTLSWRYAIRTDRPPTDAEVRAGPAVDGRDFMEDLSDDVTLVTGDIVYAGAFAYSMLGGIGTESVAPAVQALATYTAPAAGSVSFGLVSVGPTGIDTAADEITFTTSVTGSPAALKFAFTMDGGAETLVENGLLDITTTFILSRYGSSDYTNDVGHGIDLKEFDDPGGPFPDFLIRGQFRAYDAFDDVIAVSSWKSVRVYGT